MPLAGLPEQFVVALAPGLKSLWWYTKTPFVRTDSYFLLEVWSGKRYKASGEGTILLRTLGRAGSWTFARQDARPAYGNGALTA